jgi:hypothetical protein
MSALRAVLLPVVAALLVTLAWVAPSGDTPDDDRRPGRVDVTQTAYACPAGGGITVAAGQVTAGTAVTTQVSPDATEDEALQDPAAWRTSDVDGTGVIVQQKGRASGAAGFFSGTAPRSGGGGLVVGACPGITDDAWFLGLGSGGKHFSTLVLTNLADSPAAVDLRLWSTDGPVEAVGAEGVVVEPFTTLRLKLEDLAAGEPELAVQVRRLRGAVSALVNDSSTGEERGTEPISPTSAPSRDQVVGGLVDGDRGRTLLLLNPGDQTARVEVETIGAEGTFVPEGLTDLKVAAGSLRTVTVPRAAGADPQGLRVTSDRPVSATVRMAPSDRDYAYAEGVPALAGPAIVPLDVGDDLDAPALELTAPGRDAEVDLQAYDAAMEPLASATVELTGGTTQHLELAKELELGDAAYVVVRPAGEVVAAATYADGDLLSSLALGEAPVSVLAPQVRPAP